jgi:hypothetical protein
MSIIIVVESEETAFETDPVNFNLQLEVDL